MELLWSFDSARQREAWVLGRGPAVLFADGRSELAPLPCLYWSGDSQSLVSAHPGGVVEEIEGFYCGQCFFQPKLEDVLDGHDATCPTCHECPSCQALLSPAATGDAQAWTFKCTFCGWSSASVGLREADAEDLGMTLEIWERETTEQLAEDLEHATQPSSSSTSAESLLARAQQRDDYAALLEKLQQQQQPPSPPPQQTQPTVDPGAASTMPARSLTWQFADAEARVLQAATVPAIEPAADSPFYARLVREGCLAETPASPVLWAGASDERTTTLDQRMSDPGVQPMDVRGLMPRRKKLLCRRSLRCAKDVEAGHTGLLVKPKADPLEGDSSSQFKNKVGEWFKKLSAGVNFVPRVSVVAAPALDPGPAGGADDERSAAAAWTGLLRLRVANTREERVAVWLAPPLSSDSASPPGSHADAPAGGAGGTADDALEADATAAAVAAAALARASVRTELWRGPPADAPDARATLHQRLAWLLPHVNLVALEPHTPEKGWTWPGRQAEPRGEAEDDRAGDTVAGPRDEAEDTRAGNKAALREQFAALAFAAGTGEERKADAQPQPQPIGADTSEAGVQLHGDCLARAIMLDPHEDELLRTAPPPLPPVASAVATQAAAGQALPLVLMTHEESAWIQIAVTCPTASAARDASRPQVAVLALTLAFAELGDDEATPANMVAQEAPLVVTFPLGEDGRPVYSTIGQS